MTTYKVEVVEMKSKKVVDIIGTNLSERKAEKVERGVLINLDRENYLVRTPEELRKE